MPVPLPMSTSLPPDRAAQIRDKLAGYPPGTADAVIELLRTGAAEPLDRAATNLLQFHLPARPDREKPAVASLDGTTRLREDLQIDSLTFAELGFLVEDVLGVRLPEEDLESLQTIDDFRACLRRAAQRA